MNELYSFLPKALIHKAILLIVLSGLFQHTLVAQNKDSLSIYMQLYEYEKVIRYIENQKLPYTPNTELLKANAYVGLKNYEKAIASYEILCSNDSANINTLIELAGCYQSIDNNQQAIFMYLKALNLNPLNSYLHLQLADAYVKNNEYSQAILHYYTSCSNDTSFYISKQLALCYDKLNKTDTAIYYYYKTLNLQPKDFYSAYRLANIHLKNNDITNALDVTSCYLSNDSNNVKMLALNGYIHYQNKAFVEALKSFEKCLSLNDSSDFTKRYLGYCYFETHNYNKSKTYLEQAYENDTSSIILCYTLGLACHYANYGDLAIYYLNKTLALTIPSPEFLSRIYQDLAAAQTGIYKVADALDCYLEALELTPDDTLLLFRIASQYDKFLQNKTMAIKYYQSFLQNRPEDKSSHPTMKDAHGLQVSYYDIAQRRIKELKEELFMQGEKPKDN